MKDARPFVALTAAWALGCVSPSPRPRAPAFFPAQAARPELVETRVLPSGLRLILDRDPLSRMVVVASAVEAGANGDPPGKGGLAHLVEHLTFRGVDARQGPAPLWQRLNRLPMTPPFYATTSWEQMRFRSMAPAAVWRGLLAIEAGRLADPLGGVDEKAVELERAITEDQAHMSDDDAEVGSWRDLLGDDVTPDESSIDDTGGNAASRATLTLADARTFVSQRFRPVGMTLVIAGHVEEAVSLDDIVGLLPRALVEAPASGAPRSPPAPARPARPTPVPSPTIAQVPVPALDRPVLMLTWRVPSLYSSDGPALRWMARLLTSVLDAEELRRIDPRIASIDVQLQSSTRGALLVVQVELTNATNPAALTQLVENRVLQFARWPAPERERFEELRLRLSISMALLDDPPIARALEEATLSNIFRQIVSPGRFDAALTSVTWDQVAGEAWRCLAFPPHRAVRLPAPAPAPSVPPVGPRGAPALDLLADAATWDAGPLQKLVSQPELGKAKVYALPNGGTLVFLRRKGPEAVAWLGYRGGLASGASPALVVLAANHRPRLADQAARLALVTGGDADADTTFDTVTFRPQQLEAALELLVSRARAGVANWPAPDDFRRAIAVSPRDEEPSVAAARVFWKNLYPEHPYGRTYSLNDAWRVTLPAATQWVNEIVKPANAALVVVGDLELQEIIEATRSVTADWTRPAGRAPPPPPAPRLRRRSTGPRTAVVDQKGRSMVTLALGCVLANDPRDRARRLVLARAVGERMDNDLRHASGYTQGASVRVGEPRGTAHLMISTSIEPANLAAVLATIHRSWVRWGTTGFDAGETNAGRWAVVGQLASHFESAHQVARILFNEWVQDHPLSLFDQLPARVLEVQPADLTSTFATCRDNASLMIRGDRDAIDPVVKSIWPEIEPSL